MKKKTTPPKPWERQPSEGKKAFEAFTCYRDLGTDRSLTKVEQKYNKNRALIARWSSNWNWVERANAWDDELDRRTREEIAKGVTSMRKKHIDISNAMLTKALKAMSELNPKDMTPKDIKEFIKLATELERISRIPEMDGKDGETEGRLADLINGLMDETAI